MLLFSGFILFLFLIMQPLEVYYGRKYIAVLFAKGIIAIKERNLLFIIQALMLLVVIPVYFLTFLFSWRYREHSTARYEPDMEDSKLTEILWWGIPCVLTLIIAILTWQKTYELDPFRPLKSDKKPLTIQVVALQWKWLFIYPEEKIATVNFFQFPEKTPLNFEITADAPMNSFWIPHLGGQIYAMPNMKTKLHLIADEVGEYRGSSANLSGEGFAGMHFIAKASTDEEYKKWVQSVKSSETLSFEGYNQLAQPSTNTPPAFYSLKDGDLFHKIMMKYMPPMNKSNTSTQMSH